MVDTLQQKYNLSVVVEVCNETMSLALAVKLVGGASRKEKMWADAAGEGNDRFSFLTARGSRKTDEEYAEKQVEQSYALKQAEEAGSWAAALKKAIAIGNAKEIELDIENPDLLS